MNTDSRAFGSKDEIITRDAANQDRYIREFEKQVKIESSSSIKMSIGEGKLLYCKNAGIIYTTGDLMLTLLYPSELGTLDYISYWVVVKLIAMHKDANIDADEVKEFARRVVTTLPNPREAVCHIALSDNTLMGMGGLEYSYSGHTMYVCNDIMLENNDGVISIYKGYKDKADTFNIEDLIDYQGELRAFGINTICDEFIEWIDGRTVTFEDSVQLSKTYEDVAELIKLRLVPYTLRPTINTADELYDYLDKALPRID